MGSTTPYQLRYPEYAAGADPKLDLQKLAEDVAPRLHRAEPLTAAQITAVASPRIGQLVLNTDTGRVQYWDGGTWRNVGATAAGSVALPAQALTTSFAAGSVFIGVGLTDLQFGLAITLSSQPNGAGYGAQMQVSTDAATAFGIVATADNNVRTFTASANTDYAELSLYDSVGATITVRLRNMRIEASTGLFRYEIAAASGTPTTHTSRNRINWKAR